MKASLLPREAEWTAEVCSADDWRHITIPKADLGALLKDKAKRQVIKTDVPASNGVIHEIDTVLIPT